MFQKNGDFSKSDLERMLRSPEAQALLARLQQLDQEDKLSDLQRELKRTDLSEGERAALLQQITNLIRAKK